MRNNTAESGYTSVSALVGEEPFATPWGLSRRIFGEGCSGLIRALEINRAMRNRRTGFAKRATPIVVTTLGLILMATPLALLVAWTPFLLVAVLTVGVVSAALLIVLHDLEQSGAGDRHGPTRSGPMAILPDGFVEEVHRIFPLTYHHGPRGSARFRRTMGRLRRLLADRESSS